MDLKYRITHLQHAFWNGDRAARDALARLLRRYVGIVVRRKLRLAGAEDWLPPRMHGDSEELDSESSPGRDDVVADKICQQLCDELLQVPVTRQKSPAAETLRASLTLARRKNG